MSTKSHFLGFVTKSNKTTIVCNDLVLHYKLLVILTDGNTNSLQTISDTLVMVIQSHHKLLVIH